MRVLERSIERYFVTAARGLGCLVYKLHDRGVPDRLVIAPDRSIAFVELKRPGGKPRAEQSYYHKMLRARGLKVYVVDSRDAVIETLSEILYGDQRVLKAI